LTTLSKKILSETANLYGYTEEYAPKFRSTPTAFHVIFRNMNYNLDCASEQVSEQGGEQVSDQHNRFKKVLYYCETPRARSEIQAHIGIASRRFLADSILKPLLESGQLR